MDTQTTLAEAREQTDRLFEVVRPEFLYARPIPERHRIVFYIGHLEAFDWNLFEGRASGPPGGYDKLFAFGIDPVDGGLPKDEPADWPTIEEVRAYSAEVRERLNGKNYEAELLHVALEHRLMHAETLAYMFHQLPAHAKVAPCTGTSAIGQAEPPASAQTVEISAGRATLGLARNSGFGWDNEFDAHTVDVPAFTIDKYKVTNAGYLRFVESGGYRNPGLWSASAWQWKSAHGIEHPVFWKRTSQGWNYRTMFDEIPLPPHWPVYVSHAEATAYANWTGGRLPTEAEWHRAAYGTPGTIDDSERSFPWGEDEPAARHGYFDFARWDPAPVNAFPAAGSAFGVEGLLANGWEWTATPFAPFKGFQARSFYPGYSADFFDGRHFVMKGGSTRTAACMLRRSFRNWFQGHYQYVYSGFRCVRTAH